MGEFFLHPGLAVLGGLMVSVPILIHLLNRRRFQVVQWGAMAFLLAAYKKTRRRLELENLILLLLRALAVALIGLAIARPSLSPESPIASAFAGRREVVIALDASYSMAYRDGGSTAFERGIAAARGILESLKPARQDQVTLILAKDRPVHLSRRDIDKARRELSRITEPTFEGINLAASLDLAVHEIDAFLGEGSEAKGPNANGATLYLITDLQRSTFFPRTREARGAEPAAGAAAPTAPTTPDGAKAPAASVAQTPLQAAAVALAQRKVAVRVLDVGAQTEGAVENVGVVDVRCGEELPAVGVSVELRATLRNFGSAPRANVLITPTVDGSRGAPQTVSLSAGETREVTLPITFRDPGDHSIDVAIDEDRLLVDDHRPYVIRVRPALRVLLVDGSPDPDPEISAAGMMSLVLSPPEEPMAAAPFSLVGGGPIDRARFASQQDLLDQTDILILANVEGFSEETASRIQEFAESGGGVLFLCGDRVDAAAYTTRLRRGNDPRKWLLPATVGAIREVPSREHRPWRIATLPDPLPSYFQFFEAAERRVLLTEVPIYRFLALDVSEDDTRGGAQVIGRFNDPEISPFFVTKPLGRGRVGILSTALGSPPDRRWNRISDSVRTFVPLLFDMLHALAAGIADVRNVRINEAIRAEVRGFPSKATVVDPTGRSEKLNVESAKRASEEGAPSRGSSVERYLLPAYTSTDRPGIYSLEVEAAGGVATTTTSTLKYAVAIDPEEGDLTRAPGSTIGTALPTADVKLSSGVEEESLPPIEGPRSEIWKALVAAAIAVLVIESALATWFGRRRS